MSKSGAGLAKWAEDIHAGGQYAYWWGTYCNKCTTALLSGKTKQYPNQYGANRQATYKKHIQQGKMCTDCVGLIKGYYWEKDGVIKYGRDGLPDKGASGMWAAAKIKGKIADGMPEIPGLLVWTQNKGHIAVYVGNGEEVEARGFSYGMQRNAMSKRNFKYWGLCPYVPYTEAEIKAAKAAMGTTQTAGTAQEPQKGTQDAPKVQGGVNMPTIKNGAQGVAVKVMQRLLMAAGCKLSKYGADGKYGAETVAAVKAFQTTHNLAPDGECGPLTWAALAG